MHELDNNRVDSILFAFAVLEPRHSVWRLFGSIEEKTASLQTNQGAAKEIETEDGRISN